jgi:hypothetical protein
VRRAALAAIAAGVVLLAGCGGGEVQADLFLVTRITTSPHRVLTMRVNDSGNVTCNGREHMLPSKRLLNARVLQRDLKPFAERNLRLAPGPSPVFRYRVRTEDGTVAFADDSRGVPLTFQKLTLFVLQVGQTVCGLPQ